MPNKYPFLQVLFRECKRIFGEGAALFVVIIGPLFGFFLITSIFYSSVPRKLPVAVVDLDHTSLSRKAALFTDATPIASINKNFTSLQEARNAMAEGKVDAVLFIPEGTEKNILHGTHSNIELYLNNANVIKGSLLNSGIQKAIKTLSAGIKLQKYLQTGATEKQAIAQIMPIALHSQVLFNPFNSYAYFITLILLPVTLTVFTMFGTLYAIGSELQYGTTEEWMRSANNSIVIALAGKLLPYTLFFCMVAMFMNIDFFVVLGLPLKGSLTTILLSELLLILSYQSIALIFITLAKNMRLAISLASVFTMLAVTYAGFTFPTFGMPEVAQVLNRIFPIGYWTLAFTGQSVRTEDISNAYFDMMYMAGFVLLGMFFVPRLKYIVSNKKYWGKI